MSTTSIDEFPWLSEQDINVLWEIVQLAESSHETPYRALFSAYDTVLKRHGIEEYSDQIYFRFLLRMRRDRAQNITLRAQFESLLARHGIQIDFYGGDEDESRHRENPEVTIQSDETDATRQEVQTPARRASFTSLYDQDPSQYSTQPDLRQDLPVRPRSQNAAIDLRKYAPARSVRFQSTEHVYSRQRAAKTSHVPDRQAAHHVAVRTRDGAVHKDGESMHQDSVFEVESSDGSIFEEDVRSIQKQGLRAAAAPISFADPKELEARAKALRFHHLAAQACAIFRQWARRASMQSHISNEMSHSAKAKDREILKRQAFDGLRSSYLERKQQKETERFFATLEKKAGKARDLYLLTKAFTHWAQSTSDEIARTSAARRQILRTRYFNAWRDITVVNELKVRRLSLSKFLDRWREKASRITRQNNAALSLYETRLTLHTYRNWFWTFCDRRAPTWYGTKLQIQYFEKWRQSTRQSSTRQIWAEDFAQLKLMRNVFLQLVSRSTVISQDKEKAIAFRSRWLLVPAVENLQRQLQLAPLQSQVERSVDVRLLSVVLHIWNNKARKAKIAAQINELRIMRNAWTNWNDRLRCQSLQKTINDRIAMQALYNWVLAERCILFERVAAEKQKRFILNKLRNKLDYIRNELGNATSALQNSNQRRSANLILQTWLSRSQEIAQESDQALAHHDHQVTKKALSTWSSRYEKLTHLAAEAQDAHFYILANSAIQTWRAKTKASRKAKRRAAFSAIKSRRNTTLLRTCFSKLQSTSNLLNSHASLATSHYQTHLLTFETTIFTSWHNRTITLLQQHTDALSFSQNLTLQHAFQSLFNHLAHLRNEQSRAETFASEARDAAIAALLRKLNWRLFQVKRQTETADSLDERNRRKRVRAMLRHWSERTSIAARGQNDDEGNIDGEDFSSSIAPYSRQQARSAIPTPAARPPLPSSTSRTTRGFTQPPLPRPSTTTIPAPTPSFPPTTLPKPTTRTIATPAYLKTPSRRPRPTLHSRMREQEPHAVYATPTASTQTHSHERVEESAITPFMSRVRARYSSTAPFPTGSVLGKRRTAGVRAGVREGFEAAVETETEDRGEEARDSRGLGEHHDDLTSEEG